MHAKDKQPRLSLHKISIYILLRGEKFQWNRGPESHSRKKKSKTREEPHRTPGCGDWKINLWFMVGIEPCNGRRRNREVSRIMPFALSRSMSFEISSHPDRNTRIAPSCSWIHMWWINASTYKIQHPLSHCPKWVIELKTSYLHNILFHDFWCSHRSAFDSQFHTTLLEQSHWLLCLVS